MNHKPLNCPECIDGQLFPIQDSRSTSSGWVCNDCGHRLGGGFATGRIVIRPPIIDPFKAWLPPDPGAPDPAALEALVMVKAGAQFLISETSKRAAAAPSTHLTRFYETKISGMHEITGVIDAELMARGGDTDLGDKLFGNLANEAQRNALLRIQIGVGEHLERAQRQLAQANDVMNNPDTDNVFAADRDHTDASTRIGILNVILNLIQTELDALPQADDPAE